MSVKFVTLRLNLDTDQHRKVWEYLLQQRAERGQSYSDTITRVLIKSVEDDEMSELDIAGIIRNSAEQIARETESILRMTMPAFLAEERDTGAVRLRAVLRFLHTDYGGHSAQDAGWPAADRRGGNDVAIALGIYTIKRMSKKK